MNQNIETPQTQNYVKATRKSPGLAALLGILIVGLGHAYLGMWGKAIGLFIVAIIATLLTGGLLAPVFWIVSCIWAYTSAKEMNRLNGY
jgi:TM2 domain-containing membrane protein YozV